MVMLIEHFYTIDYLNQRNSESNKPHLVKKDTDRYN